MSEAEVGAFFSDPVLCKMYLSACVLTGALMCFFGYRAFKVVLGFFGVLVGGYAAASVGFELAGGSANRGAVALFCGIVGGLLGGVLMVALYLLGVFVTGATLGAVVGAVFTIFAPAAVRLIVVSVLATVGGFLALFVQRAIVVIATALNGAALVIGGLWMIGADLEPSQVYAMTGTSGPGSLLGVGATKYVLIAAWAALGCLGAWGQFSAAPPAPREEVEEDA